jgi:hypothetical protein
MVQIMMNLSLKYGFVTALALAALTLAASSASADTLELKTGSLIKGRFMGGTEAEISFQVGSTLQKYKVADIVSLKFDSDGVAADPAPPSTPNPSPDSPQTPPPSSNTS